MNFNITLFFVLAVFFTGKSVRAATFGTHTLDEVKADFVNKHNDLRRQDALDRKIAYMSQMMWNATMAAASKTYSEKCIFSHDSQRGEVGENLYMASGSRSLTDIKPLSDAVVSWYNEKQYYTFSNNSCQTGKVCGHYLQAAWASAKDLGCGVTFCPVLKDDPKDYTDAYFVVCRYVKSPGFLDVCACSNFKEKNMTDRCDSLKSAADDCGFVLLFNLSRRMSGQPFELGTKACEKCPNNCVQDSLCEYSFTYEKCEDKTSGCDQYASWGICEEGHSNYDFAQTWCRETCKFC